jgi:hypothetical protein
MQGRGVHVCVSAQRHARTAALKWPVPAAVELLGAFGEVPSYDVSK